MNSDPQIKEKKKLGCGCGPVSIGVLLILLGIGILIGFLSNAGDDRENHDIVSERLVVLDAPVLLPENNGRLVLVNGFLTLDSDTALTDPVFDVSVLSPRLSRVVQMYQWEETVYNEYQNNAETEYKYERVWSTRLIPSRNFRQALFHTNPSEMPHESASWRSTGSVFIGSIPLHEGFTAQLESNAFVANLPPAPPETGLGIIGENRSLYSSNPNGNSQIGDIRINFSYLDLEALGEVSIMAWQDEDGGGLLYDEEMSSLSKIWTTPKTKDEILDEFSKSETTGIIVGICISALFILCGVLFVWKLR